jgi:hypothetical protein
VWPDERAYATNWLDLYAQRIDAGGMLGAPTLGVPGGGPGLAAFAPPAPNPVRRGTRVALAFSLPAAGPASLVLYDVAGRLVRELVSGPQPAGAQRLAWDGRDGEGRAVPAGVYFARLEHAGGSVTRRLVTLD